MMKKVMKMKEKIGGFWTNQSGEIGIKQIAFTVALIVLIGFVLTLLKGGILQDWIEQIWDMFIELIEDFTA